MERIILPRSGQMHFGGDGGFHLDKTILQPGEPFTLFGWVELDPGITTGDHTILSMGGTSANPVCYVYYQHNNTRLVAKQIGATSQHQAQTLNGTMLLGVKYFVAARFSLNYTDCMLDLDIRTGATTTIGLPNVERLALGYRAGQNSSFMDGALSNCGMAKGHLKNGLLQALARGANMLEVVPHNQLLGAWLDGSGKDYSGRGHHLLTKTSNPVRVIGGPKVRAYIPTPEESAALIAGATGNAKKKLLLLSA